MFLECRSHHLRGCVISTDQGLSMLIRYLTAILLIVWTHASIAQEAPRHKIGWLKVQSSNHAPEELISFIDGLRAHGHVQGKTFDIEERYAEGDPNKLHRLVDELIGLQVTLPPASPSWTQRTAPRKQCRLSHA